MSDAPAMPIPKLHLGRFVEDAIAGVSQGIRPLTQTIAWLIGGMIDGLTEWLVYCPPAFLILLLAVLAYHASRRAGVTIFTALGLAFVWNLDLWVESMQTLSMVIVATALSMLVGLPLGVAAALNDHFRKILVPILDFMQTLPAFVYLIPVIIFFSTGVTPGLLATVIFAIPPAIRLTDLGIRQTPAELVECAEAFGSTWYQKLLKLQLPMAMGSIRAGVNQTVMLALSMVVIAGMVGAPGLGAVVYGAITQVRIGQGFEGGICVVILAIVLDRMLQSVGTTKAERAR